MFLYIFSGAYILVYFTCILILCAPIIYWRKCCKVFRFKIDYCINDYVDEYDQEDMVDFFQSSESGSLDEASNMLTENSLSVDQFRLMRIKFLSEYVN